MYDLPLFDGIYIEAQFLTYHQSQKPSPWHSGVIKAGPINRYLVLKWLNQVIIYLHQAESARPSYTSKENICML